MHMFNRDGSEGMMCGNGIRCTAKYIYDHGLVPAERENVLIETGSGLKRIFLYKESGKVSMAKVDMGAVVSGTAAEVITVAGMELKMTREDVGNPHAVFFIEDNPCLRVNGYMTTDSIDSLGLFLIGPHIENHEAFQGRVNAEFAEVISRREVRMRVWERGSGETMACGTGSCATLVAAQRTGRVGVEADVILDGGTLHIKHENDGPVLMTGPAQEVFKGTI